MKINKINKTLLILSFSCYLIILFWIIFFKCNHIRAIEVLINNYLPLNLKERFLYQERFIITKDPQCIKQTIFNIFVFIPLTLYLPLFSNHQNIKKDLVIAFLLTLSIEITELYTALGGFEIKDIITNMLGALIGCYIFKLCKRHTLNKTINIINLVIVIIALPISVYSIIKTINCIDMYQPFFDKLINKF